MGKRGSGFTLIEIVITVALMAIVFAGMAGLWGFVSRVVRANADMAALHAAEADARRLVMGISRDFRAGGTRDVVVGGCACDEGDEGDEDDEDGCGGGCGDGMLFGFVARAYPPVGGPAGPTERVMVRYYLVPHPRGPGYSAVVRKFFCVHTGDALQEEPGFWREGAPVMPLPVVAVRAFEVRPLKEGGECAAGDPGSAAFLGVRVRMGFADRLHARDPAGFAYPYTMDGLGRPTGPLDPVEMKVALRRGGAR